MLGESSLDQEDRRRPEEQVGTEVGFGLYESCNHPIKCDDSMPDVGGDMDVIEPTSLGADTQAGESFAVTSHWFD